MRTLWARRWWRTATLLAFAFLVWYLSRGGGSIDEAAPPRKMLLDAVEADAGLLDRVELARRRADGQESRWVFAKDGDAWQQIEPFVHPVDAWAMRKFVAIGGALEVVRQEPPTDATLKALSLDPPAATLTLIGRNRATTIDLGVRGLAGKAFLRRRSGSDPPGDILVVDAELHHRALGIDPSEWRSRALFPHATSAMSVQFDGGNLPLTLERKAGAWELVAPSKTRADFQQVEEYLAASARCESSGFVADRPQQLAVYGLDPPSATVEVTTKTESRTLLIGDPIAIGSQDRFGMMEGTPCVLRLSAATLAAVVPRFELLVSPIASGVRAADVTQIEILQPRDGVVQSLRLERTLDGWCDPFDAAARVKTDAVLQLIGALTESRAKSLAAGAANPADVVATVVLRGVGGTNLGAVIVSRVPETGEWALDDGSGVRRVFVGTTALPLTSDALLFSK